MDLLNDTPFAFGHLAWQLQPPQWALTLVVKATFDLVADGVATPAAEPRLVTGDEPFDDPDREQPSLRFESDLASLKPRGECLLAGTCHAPNGESPVAAVSFRVGPVHRRFVVFGARHFDRAGAPTDPAPFRSLALKWEHAFGGSSSPHNPVGLGLDPVDVDGRSVTPLPLIEDADALVRSAGDRPAPAGAFPIPRTWRARVSLAGTYDEAWKRTRWPWYPADFDPTYFQAAPPSQRIDGYWRGDEAVELTGLDPEHPVLRSRLPAKRVRCFVTRRVGDDDVVTEVRMNLDTITLDADTRQAMCLWRGLTAVGDDTLADVVRVAILEEPLDAPRSTDDCLARIAALEAEKAAEDGVDEEPPPPPPPVAIAEALATLPAAPDAEPSPGPAAPGAAHRAEVLRLRAHGESLAGLDLTGADLSGLDLSRADFSGAILAGANLRGATLYRTVFEEADLTGADLSGVTLQRAKLSRADLTRADLTGATLDEAFLADAVLAHAVLRTAHLTQVKSAGADYREADLRDVDATEGDFDGADLTGARMERSCFQRATLREATLAGANAEGAVFEGCVATGLRAIDGGRFVRASFANADLGRANFAASVLDEASLAFATITRADFTGSGLVKCSLDGCVGRDCCFDDARMVGASAKRADLMRGRFEGADLSWCDLRGANLFEAEFHRAKTDNAMLDLANVQRTKLERT